MSADGKVPTLGEVMAEVDAVLEYENRRYRADPALIRLIGMVAVWKRGGCPEHDYPEGWPADATGVAWMQPVDAHMYGGRLYRKPPEPQPYTVKASEVDPAKHAKVDSGRGEWFDLSHVDTRRYSNGVVRVRFYDGGDGPVSGLVFDCGPDAAVYVIDREPQP